MKKKLLALLLALCLLLAAAPTAFAYSAEEQYQMLQYADQLILQYGLESNSEDDPLGGAMIELLKAHPELYEELMKDMLSQYDSHTMYIPAGSYQQAFPSSQSYVGIGVTVEGCDEGVRVVSVNSTGGAAAAGIHTDDIIIAVNGVSLAGKLPAAAAALMRGEAGTSVAVTVLRAGKQLRFTVVRKALVEYNYSGYPVADGVFYMKWSSLHDDGSYALFRADLQKMVDEGDRCLILDLRDDPGGDLDLAFSIVSDLLPEKTAFFRTASRSTETDALNYEYVISDGKGVKLDEIYILTNENTASAAEVITAGLTDTGFAHSVGATTFGKARAQYHIPLEDDAAIVLTTFMLVSLEQGDYEGVGLKPEIAVENRLIPAQSVEQLSEQPLAAYNCSDNAEALNRALVKLGYLDAMPEKGYQLGADSQSAIDRLCGNAGLQCKGMGAPAEVLRTVNLLLQKAADGTYVEDTQYLTALQLAKQALQAEKE